MLICTCCDKLLCNSKTCYKACTCRIVVKCRSVYRTQNGREKTFVTSAKLTTNQLRKFFGEVKRQQMEGFNETDFILLKPKLAYAVGRAKDPKAKINDFYLVIANAIDRVKNEKQFKNFIQIFEAIVAYHKAAEESK